MAASLCGENRGRGEGGGGGVGWTGQRRERERENKDQKLGERGRTSAPCPWPGAEAVTEDGGREAVDSEKRGIRRKGRKAGWVDGG